MNARTQRADLPHNPPEPATPADSVSGTQSLEPGFDAIQWQESTAEQELKGAGGRTVLGTALLVLAVLWLAFTAWSAGRALADQPLTSPALSQWIAIATGPLALLGLAWIIFGRTRRREAEQFTRSVVAMRAEARSLEALLQVLSKRINDSRSELTMIAQHLMQLGDEATGKLGGITKEFDSSTDLLARQGESLDRAAESARNDIAVLLDDLPRAEATARSISEQLRSAGAEATSRTADLEQQLASLSERAREAEEMVSSATRSLIDRLGEVDTAGTAAATQVGEARSSLSSALDALLERTAATLDEIRSGIDTQSASVAALVEQASAGLGRAGTDAAEALRANVSSANSTLESLTARLKEQEEASQRIASETARALGELDQHFQALAEQGDERAAAFVSAVGQARTELQQFAEQAGAQQSSVDALEQRTAALRQAVEQLSTEVRDQLLSAVVETESAAERVQGTTAGMRPEIEWMREAASEASGRIEASASGIAEQQDRLAALLASLDDGAVAAQERLEHLSGAIAQARGEAEELSRETGPALVAAMVQVKEAAAHAAERARETIASVIPESADALSAATREALERAIRESIEERLRAVETTAARAVEAARGASERLTQQMLTLGQSAAALERHMEEQDAAQREKDSEAFARRVSLLIDSMHSAAIDVGKILSDEVDEKAWESYLKGNRGVFTRRAVRLLAGTQMRAIRTHYDADPEFQQSVNRYVHDYEAMLRRVLAERDGPMIAVTLMSSDMGKLYAALAEAIERRR